MARKPKFTRAQIKRHVRRIQEATEKQRRKHEQRGEQFVSITPEQIEKKLKRVNSPFITGHGYNPKTTPGGTVPYVLYFYNADTTQYGLVFAQVWIGSGNIDPNLSTFLLNVDTRFPQYKQPADISGLTLDANTFASFDFTLHVPRTIDRANYFIQSCLMQAHWFDVGTYFDRGMVVLNVT